MTAAVQIFILSCDRPAYFRQALTSVLAQDCGDAEVIVSDNSERDEVQTLVRAEFPGVNFIRRQPQLPALEHFRAVIEESSAEYLVLFHDDDIMLPGYIGAMLAAMRAHPGVSAVGCNASTMQGDTRTGKRFMGSVTTQRLIDNAHDLLRCYLELGTEGPAPFPGYMYRHAHVRGLYLDAAEGGKHADVTFLTKLLGRGPILWLPEPLMAYRFHGGNDSRLESVAERLSWMRHMISKDGVDRKSPWLTDFRFYYWSRWWLQRGPFAALRPPRGWRERTVFRFLVATAFGMATTRPSVWRRLLRRFG